jgi:hypothetical protein
MSLAQCGLSAIIRAHLPSYPIAHKCEDTREMAVFVSVYYDNKLIGCVGTTDPRPVCAAV